MLRRFSYSWDVRFAVTLPLVNAIVSGLLLWSVGPPPIPDPNVAFDLVDPIEYQILFVLNPPCVVIASVLPLSAFYRHLVGAAFGCLLWWRVGLYIDRMRRKEPIKRSIILLFGTILWAAFMLAGITWGLAEYGGEGALRLPLAVAAFVSATILWPAAGFLAARDVRPKHLIS